MGAIKRAVITAAGERQRSLALQTLVDRDGVTKSVLRILLEEALSVQVERIAVVVWPGDQPAYAAAAGELAGQLTFVEQREARGYGHALFCARSFVGEESFLHLVNDHLFVSEGERGCAQQLVEVAAREACAVSAVQATRERMLPYYGTVGGALIPGKEGLYQVEAVVEKPTPTEAEQRLGVPGLRAGQYLCFFGLHVLTPAIFELLEAELAQAGDHGVISLSLALDALAGKERYLALELEGRRYHIGARYGLLTAQLALALKGKDREEVLSDLVELLALRMK